MVEYVMEITAKKSFVCGKYGSLENMLMFFLCSDCAVGSCL